MGRAAGSALTAGARGRVIARFERSFYVETGEGALACIGPAGMGRGPLSALCPAVPPGGWAILGIRVSTPVTCRVGVVAAGVARFDLSRTRRWTPPAPRSRPAAENVAAGLDLLAGGLAPFALEEGIAPLVPALAGGRPAAPSGDPLRDRFAAALGPLRAWLSTADDGEPPPDPPPDALAGLVGLGPGLTPSGDDFLGGLMIGLRTLGRGATADGLGAWLAPVVAGGTSRISRAHLDAAREGEGADALHRTLAAMIDGDREGLSRALVDLDAIGHSSGWDALAGAVAALGAWRASPGRVAEAGT